MAEEARVHLEDPDAIAALTHPVRWKLLNYLMSSGPATASQGARAVGDTPSNCSYHLRTLAKYGWVEADGSADARERPWRALVTGFSLEQPGDIRRRKMQCSGHAGVIELHRLCAHHG